MGSWFIQEYQYPKEMKMADLSCLMFKFYEDATGIMGNFTFRFPPVYEISCSMKCRNVEFQL